MDGKIDNEGRDFLKKPTRGSFLVSAGLFIGPKETFANLMSMPSGKCGSSFDCARR